MGGMSKGRHPKIGGEHLLPRFQSRTLSSKEKQFNPDDLAESYLNIQSLDEEKFQR
jgi:hypothetical protein